MKITIIHGQNHQGSTCNIARMLTEKLGGNVEEFFLPRDFGAHCTGCTQCFSVSETLCPHAEQLLPITKSMDSADIIILASPVYVYHVTGAMKTFLDHYGWRWMIHRPEEKMFSKQAVCISTAAGSGTKTTNQDMAHNTFFWGIAKTYKYGVSVMETSWQRVNGKKKQKIEKDIDALAKRIRRDYGRVKPSIKTKAFFALTNIIHKRGWNEYDVNHWREKGWDKKERPWKQRAK